MCPIFVNGLVLQKIFLMISFLNDINLSFSGHTTDIRTTNVDVYYKCGRSSELSRLYFM